jgi:hypothetical protein
VVPRALVLVFFTNSRSQTDSFLIFIFMRDQIS